MSLYLYADIYLDPSGRPALTKIGINNVTLSTAITDTNFHHVAVTKSGSTVVFYIDGVAYSVPAYDPGFVFSTSPSLGGIANQYTFLGSIDELSIYNRALAAGELQSIYNAGSAGKCSAPVSPFILMQPTNRTVTVGQPVSFTVVAGGSAPLRYQWALNGTNIAGATNSTFTLTSAQLADAGNYSVRVTNVAGSTNSGAALLTVNPLPACAAPPVGLVGWWRLEGNATDQVGGHDGSLVGSAAYVPAEVGSGLNLTGPPQGISVPNDASLNFGSGVDFSIEAWVKPVRATTSYDGMNIVDKRSTPNDNQAVGYELDLTGGRVAFLLSDSLSNAYLLAGPAGPDLRDGAWHHVAVTVARASTNGGKLYVDGQVVLTFNPTAEQGDLTTTNALLIGMHPRYPSIDLNFRGTIDEVSVYRRALGPTDVQAIYHADGRGKCVPTPPAPCAPSPAGLVSWWRGETNALDQAGTNNGTLAGNATFGGGRVGQSFVLDGNGDAVRLGNPASLRLQDLTIEAWVKRASSSVVTYGSYGIGVLFGYGNGGYGLFLDPSGTPALSQIGSSAVSPGVRVADTNYHHLAVTKSGSAVVFYLDGVAYPASAYDPGFTFSTSAAVGAKGDTLDNSFLGSIDELPFTIAL